MKGVLADYMLKSSLDNLCASVIGMFGNYKINE